MYASIAAMEPTTGGDARIDVISTHGADIGLGSRIRIRFQIHSSGKTDNGLTFGGSIHADNAGGGATGTGDSALMAGAFDTITFGDTAGAAKQADGQVGCADMIGLDD